MAAPMTRQSTPKYEVIHTASGTVTISGVSKTYAIKFARAMAGDRRGSFTVRPAKRTSTPPAA